MRHQKLFDNILPRNSGAIENDMKKKKQKTNNKYSSTVFLQQTKKNQIVQGAGFPVSVGKFMKKHVQ